MLENRNQILIQEILQKQMKLDGLDAMIITSPEAIFYATGFASQFLYLSNNIGLTVAVVPKEGKISLILNEFEKQAANSTCKDIEVISYPVWIYIEDYAKEEEQKSEQPDLNLTYSIASEIIFEKYKNPNIGVESEKISYFRWKYLKQTFGEDKLYDCSRTLINSRAIKTNWEIDVLRKAAQISEVAMYQTAKAIVPGMTEADVMTLFKNYCQDQSPDVMMVLQAHTLGSDFAPAVIPRHNRISLGDVIRLDGGPLYCGYGADLARTFVVGTSTYKKREEIYAILWKAYKHALDIIRPGVKISDVFNSLQQMLANDIPGYRRGHFGHSIGCNRFTEEYPFISANEHRVFEPNMVFCIEVPYYSSKNHSYNIEDTFLVTEDGIELFTHANESLYL